MTVATPLGQGGPHIATYSERTLVVALEFDRDVATILSYTAKARPFVRDPAIPGARLYAEGHDVQLELVLFGPGDSRLTQRVEVGPVCLEHAPGSEPHVAGDTIRVHRDSFIVELPDVVGFDRVELAYYENDRASSSRRSLGTSRLSRETFDAAAGPLIYEDLMIADAGTSSGDLPTTTASDPLWPEDFGDTDIFLIYGDAVEGDRRINIVIVPDGYTYAEKSLMETHATEMVQKFRSKTPFAQHDPFINYTLVYAYSQQSGTDQCDCSIILNTAMGTRFPSPNPACGHSDNRCLYYGSTCDSSGTTNIVTAELRAPYHDETVIMVNTTRYGGCGGSRAAYSAGNSSAKEIAVHELGHSLGGLADEYSYNASCGVNAGGVNTSKDPINGDWPEWIADIGAPREGAQYYQQCLYRPQTSCEMRSLNIEFCPVCNQHWSLLTFGHARVNPTAPIESATPSSFLASWVGVPVEFTIATRLSSGAPVTNDVVWTLNGPGFVDTTVATQVEEYEHTFTQPGLYSLKAEVTADTNFVKPSKYGANRESMTWAINATVLAPPLEVSPPGTPAPLTFQDRQSLTWEDAAATGSFTYNLYRGDLSGVAGGDYGTCLVPDLPTNQGPATLDPPSGTCWIYLVAGSNPAAEGPLGQSSAGAPRHAQSPCN